MPPVGREAFACLVRTGGFGLTVWEILRTPFLFMNIHRYFGGLRAVRFLTLALLSLSAHAATLTWNGGSGGPWEDPMRWLPQQVPGADDTAIIGGTQETLVTVTGTHFVGTRSETEMRPEVVGAEREGWPAAPSHFP